MRCCSFGKKAEGYEYFLHPRLESVARTKPLTSFLWVWNPAFSLGLSPSFCSGHSSSRPTIITLSAQLDIVSPPTRQQTVSSNTSTAPTSIFGHNKTAVGVALVGLGIMSIRSLTAWTDMAHGRIELRSILLGLILVVVVFFLGEELNRPLIFCTI